MAKSPPPIAACALCKKTTTLRWSHILSAWVYRRAINLYDDGNNKLVRITDGVASYDGQQLAEYMLCDACERRLKLWEDPAAALAFQPLGKNNVERFPALKNARLFAHNEQFHVVDMSLVDVDALARFALSIVWRAHVSEQCPKIDLGEYAEPLRELLLAADDRPVLPAWLQVWLQLVVREPFDRVAAKPWPRIPTPDATFRVFDVLTFGFWFQILVGPGVLTMPTSICASRSRRALLHDARDLGPGIMKLAQSAAAIGQLAKDKRNGKV